ncbi:MAG: hypothetical protein J6W96_02025 [Alphaproteobacteria bacterium]|nr:hypothetical protein [Alphaproteobacteria bacterium]
MALLFDNQQYKKIKSLKYFSLSLLHNKSTAFSVIIAAIKPHLRSSRPVIWQLLNKGERDCPFPSPTYSKQGQPHLLPYMQIKGLNIGNFGRLYIYNTMCHWRQKSRQNGLFCAQNKPILMWMNAAEYTALASGGRRR